MPLVSIIVPNYNHAAFLEQRIGSILNQTVQDFELILLDDCSTDRSREIMEAYRDNPHVSRIIYNEANSGSAFKQWKKGIDLAQGEWVWIAESDDWAEPTFLEELLVAANQHPKCVLLTTPPCYHFPDGSTWQHPLNIKDNNISGESFARQYLLNGNTLPNVSALLLREEALKQIDFTAIETMRLCGDWLLYAQMCTLGEIVEVNKTLSYFRQHGDSTSATAERQGRTLIEGVNILSYLISTFRILPWCYARAWGRTWSKLESKHHFDRTTKKAIYHAMRHFPHIVLWHSLYRIKYLL